MLLPIFSSMLLALGANAEEAAPQMKQTGNEVEIQNTHFRAVFSKDSGGLLSGLFHKTGTPIIREAHIYTDGGVYESRFYVGSRYETQSSVKCERRDGAVEYQAEGILRVKPGDAHKVEPMHYRIKFSYDSSDAIRVSWGVMPEFNKELEGGFLAYTMQLPDFTQWFANTQDGVVCEEAASESRRTFQSSVEPLSLTEPRVGVIAAKGPVLIFEGFRSSVPIQNVFFHEAKGPSAMFFVAILDGPTTLKLEKGKWWQVDFSIRVLDSIAQLEKR
jgi:hypothetical protein